MPPRAAGIAGGVHKVGCATILFLPRGHALFIATSDETLMRIVIFISGGESRFMIYRAKRLANPPTGRLGWFHVDLLEAGRRLSAIPQPAPVGGFARSRLAALVGWMETIPNLPSWGFFAHSLSSWRHHRAWPLR